MEWRLTQTPYNDGMDRTPPLQTAMGARGGRELTVISSRSWDRQLDSRN
jgi:hypothetical protein